jgi:flagellar hook-length control protein FliK
VIQTTPAAQVKTGQEGAGAQTIKRKSDKLGVFAKILDGLTAKTNAAGKVVAQKKGASALNAAATSEASAKKAASKAKKTAGDTLVDAKTGKKVSDTASGAKATKKKTSDTGSDQALISLIQFQKEQRTPADALPADTALSETRPVEQEAAFTSKSAAKSKMLLSMKDLAAQADAAVQTDKALSPKSVPSAGVPEKRPAKDRDTKGAKRPVGDARRVSAETATEGTTQSLAAKTVTGGKRPDAKDTKLDRARLDLRDLRSRESAAQSGDTSPVSKADPVGEPPTVELSLDLSVGAKSREASFELNASRESGNTGENLLAQELADHLNSDLVQQAQILLKDGNAGTIRLSLRPETLGNVKVHLEMVENKITGHIIVESAEALRAFEREMADLEQAFRDSGFAGASFDASLAPDTGGKGGAEEWRQQEMRPFFSERLSISRYEPETPANEIGLSEVNMLA